MTNDANDAKDADDANDANDKNDKNKNKQKTQGEQYNDNINHNNNTHGWFLMAGSLRVKFHCIFVCGQQGRRFGN